ncbi:MAG: Zn-dependent protease [Bdellovibrionales bacterium RIFOXYD12_FULL_39_22]|nr:MAG: Zn-dependent protease [Bdellovibrionales bacterium RIFOXYB1_FULL_39_21]OFZ40722.1 MAG: Zn-dependent protease [Bdellovibrionales bacterium RIFOXYC12_FULL_39_17]OFZ48144.1 MAG: Zn-dependent protease [Bdellovibrionales bacterium RIFOXYC1_FULL_39_130]OFZ75794.1 MAG: Zn-dependent protease [Bdellovibrionales bacterium RIFOXYD1_FULL_39_84]OFZ91855.1 MAG: Zn-dependent protease [Bdellovibrionales bacterium RIFOXYD12_FULL_39_22]HLE11363.1 TldD/PmbA family protein [Bacteriovoracaceae bacterium]
MLDKLQKHLSKIKADYADIRYEKMRETRVGFTGQDLTGIGPNDTDGYVIRVYKNGGFATISVTCEADIDKAISRVIENATILGKNSDKKVSLKFPNKVEEVVGLELDGDPRKISLSEKHKLTKHYNDLMLAQKDVQSTTIGYSEVYRDKYFVSTLGSKINEKTITTSLGGMIICKKGNVVQNGTTVVGGSNGFNRLVGREQNFLDRAKTVSELLDAEPVKGGTYNVVLEQSMTGVFTHEAFGHFSEADLIENSPTMLAKMQIGQKLGTEILDIVDDPTRKGQVGHYKYDDEGVLARPVDLMKNGVLSGRLHSLKTAAAFNEPITGHTIAEDSRYEPIVRMGCIFIKPREKSFQDLLTQAGNGLYVVGNKGGQTSGENFTFGAQYAYTIKNGKLDKLVRDINLMGNLFTTLGNIVGIGNDIEFSERGGCGKGQMNIKSCYGGPHILIKDALVGGV